MPYENITIEAKWVDNVTNPNTGRSTYVLSFLLISVIGIFVISLVKKKKKF
jgi:LPXTG-motif cell wall-anchored protein